MAFIKKSPQGVLGCGIVGFSGDNNYNLDKIKGLMIWNSVERGDTGVLQFAFLPFNNTFLLCISESN